MEQTIDITPTPSGTLRIWARLLEEVGRSRMTHDRREILDTVIADLKTNANRLGDWRRE